MIGVMLEIKERIGRNCKVYIETGEQAITITAYWDSGLGSRDELQKRFTSEQYDALGNDGLTKAYMDEFTDIFGAVS